MRPFPPLDYPWSIARAPMVVAAGRSGRAAAVATTVRRIPLPVPDPAIAETRDRSQIDEALGVVGGQPAAGRIAVVAVGSNASPEVLVDKLGRFGVSTAVALLPCEVRGLGVGHSAHVSPRGYIAAAPFAAAGSARLMLLLLTPEQLDAVDATEPNYRRRCLDDTAHRVTSGGQAVTGVWIYESAWGVLAGSSGPVALQSQQTLHHSVAQRDPGFARHARGRTPEQLVQRLSSPQIRDELRDSWSTSLSMASGLALVG